ncbi:12-(S)-hydroxy-5,8,10,14-eicosatetraenoic acid receptor-like [Littorina saxatilis]|uniref:12-(S)-hydroxy-5,8,10,14-eicosatetraenoic acid receptor-like n=1 Tax=Littorina saxatilis TaxID=31220 RepID=UPI0038B4CAC8
MAAKNFAFMSQRNQARAWTKVNASANVTGGFSAEDLMGYPEYAAFTYIWHYGPPVLLGVGVPGNLVTIAVLRRMWSQGSAQLPFLLTLAVADLCLLLSGLLFDMCFYIFDCDLRHLHVLPCQVLTFVMNAANSVSAWLLVAVTAQRAVSVTRPQRVASCCSLKVRGRVLAAIIVTSCLLQLHVLIGGHVPGAHPDGFCTVTTDRDGVQLAETLAVVWSMVDLMTSCVLPSLVLVVCNVFLIRGLRASERELRHLAVYSNTRKRLAASMTTAVPFLSLSFLLLTSPIYVYILWHQQRGDAIDRDPQLLARAELVWAVTNMLWYANSTVNFLLYCGSGRHFRKEFFVLMRLWFCWCCRAGRLTYGSHRRKDGSCPVESHSPGFEHVSSRYPLTSTSSFDGTSPIVRTVCFKFPATAPSFVELMTSGDAFMSWQDRHGSHFGRHTSNRQINSRNSVSSTDL